MISFAYFILFYYSISSIIIITIIIIIFGETGVWTQGFALALAMPLVHFSLVILEMGGGSLELFAWAGLELKSSQSQPPK
jgi:hypothetical protein